MVPAGCYGGEDAKGRIRLPVVVVAPALGGAVGFEPARMAPAGGDGGEALWRGIGLSVLGGGLRLGLVPAARAAVILCGASIVLVAGHRIVVAGLVLVAGHRILVAGHSTVVAGLVLVAGHRIVVAGHRIVAAVAAGQGVCDRRQDPDRHQRQNPPPNPRTPAHEGLISLCRTGRTTAHRDT